MAICFVIEVLVAALGCYAYVRWVCGVGPLRERRTAIDATYVAELEKMMTEAEAEKERLRIEVERLRSAPRPSEHEPRAALFGRVGLSPGAPVWLVKAARRSFRIALHPDSHPAHRKEEAGRRFQLAENVFDEIESYRR